MDITYDAKTKTIIIKTTIGPGVPSGSGKSLVVASTNGFVAVSGTEYKLSVNIIQPMKVR